MPWIKGGQLFEPQGQFDWMQTHAAVPFGELVGESLYRVYFTCRDAQNRARVGRLDLDVAQAHIVSLDPNPVVDLGPLGAYDDRGVVGSWLVDAGERKYLYFSGISLGVTVPFYFYLGLAVSDDAGATFHKLSRSPILERDAIDPFLTGQVCVRVEDGLWRMWYVSGQRWELDATGQPKHYYHIKYAESKDGIRWRRQGLVCIDFWADEYAIARPCVVRDGDLYRMWYCYRGPSYRIGYAESKDGLRWERRDALAGIEVAPGGWDSEMLAYPFVFDHVGRRYMLYNGNAYGRTGIGWAWLRPDDGER